MDQQTIAFDNLVCPPCVLRVINRDADQLARFISTVTVRRLDRWLQLAMETSDEDNMSALLWLLAPIVYECFAKGTNEEVRSWLREPLLIGILGRFMSIERTKGFTTVLVRALEAIKEAGGQTESRQQLLQQLQSKNLRPLLSLTRCLMACDHHRDHIATVQNHPRHIADTPELPSTSPRQQGARQGLDSSLHHPLGFVNQDGSIAINLKHEERRQRRVSCSNTWSETERMEID
ncbi:hypothetical protein FRC19_000647 [Serendipita sp. 401]|nr:hypothetical protein FRC19_000647 [Serendipita sp. 401]KAG9028410.1 hypothetical protein FS842_004762 [Serendipita sp. 407]